MSFSFDTSRITLNNPYSAGQPFRFSYQVDNVNGDDSGHTDHVTIWDHNSATVLDQDVQAPQSVAGGLYGVYIDVPALAAGMYDVAITIAGGVASAGTTITVQ
jgi:hypothetical protein